jgi:hypothetical protein
MMRGHDWVPFATVFTQEDEEAVEEDKLFLAMYEKYDPGLKAKKVNHTKTLKRHGTKNAMLVVKHNYQVCPM